MKRSVIILMVIFLLGFTFSLSAQNFTIGVKGGLNIPNLTGGDTEHPLSSGYESRFGATYGGYGEYHMTKHFSVSIGAEYSSQGGVKDKIQAFVPVGDLVPLAAMYGVDYLYADYKSEAKMNYLLVPVMARFSWNLSKSFPLKVYAAVGPFAGFMLNAHQYTSGSSLVYADEAKTIQLPLPTAIPFDATTDIKDQLHTFNVGINCLVGFSYTLSQKSSLFVEGGGNYGFISVQKVAANGQSYTGAGTINFGYAHTF
jgi:hypothetical protein